MEHPLKGSTSLSNSPSLSVLHTEKRCALSRRGKGLTNTNTTARISLLQLCATRIGAQTPPGNSFLFLTDIKKTGEISISRSFFFYRENTHCSAQPPRPIHIWPILLGNFERNARRVGLLIYRTNTKGNHMSNVSLKSIYKSTNLQNDYLQNLSDFRLGRYRNRSCIKPEMQGLEL